MILNFLPSKEWAINIMDAYSDFLHPFLYYLAMFEIVLIALIPVGVEALLMAYIQGKNVKKYAKIFAVLVVGTIVCVLLNLKLIDFFNDYIVDNPDWLC